MFYLLLALAALGHAILWAAAVNRIHGVGIERRWIDGVTASCAIMLAVLPLPIAYFLWQHGLDAAAFRGTPLRSAVGIYVVLCATLAIVSALHRGWLTLHPERRGALLANHTTRVNLSGTLGESGKSFLAPGIPTLLGSIPGNQVVNLQVHEKQLAIPRLPVDCGGVRIAHISDLHMSGRIRKAFFEHIVDEVNRLEPDLIAITGDLVECDTCLDWLPDTLGRLRAAGGVYFVLGNHDRRIDPQLLLKQLADLGLVHLGGSRLEITVRNTRIELAGNELPWFGPEPQLDGPQSSTERLPLRVLLAHSPDLFAWAAEHDFDLILAGHNHGGQVCLPVLGPILAPSLSGTRYAGGTFRQCGTLLHVSRGTASLTPFRWNCPPEIALLELCPGK